MSSNFNTINNLTTGGSNGNNNGDITSGRAGISTDVFTNGQNTGKMNQTFSFDTF